MRRIAAVAAALAGAGCTHVSTVTHHAVSPARSIPAMERQVRNAVDAGEGDPVVRELRRRLTANPDDVKARLELAARYQRQGFPELAVEHLRFGAARTPHLSELAMRLARTLREAGDVPGAVAALADFCRRDSRPPVEIVSLLGILKDDLELYSEAEVHHRAAMALAPDSTVMHNNLGYNLLLQEKFGEAAAEFRRALALDPRSEIARNNLGTALAMSGETKEAVMHWQSISDPATAHSNLASILIEQGRHEEAKRELAIALGYTRDHAAALGNLAILGETSTTPATVRGPAAAGAWQRFASGMRRVFGRGRAEGDRSGAQERAASK
jgi:Flp pilus assembly protein TadD